MREEDYCLSLPLKAAPAVVETASFGQAARRMKVQQSTVSRRIQNLEDLVGVSLFERYSHGVRLTTAGRAFLEQACRARDMLTEAVAEGRRAGTATSGLLRLGFVWSFAAGSAQQIIDEFRGNHPTVRLQFTEFGAAELLKLTLAREIDCAWIVRWHELDAVLEVESLWSEALHLATSDRKASNEPHDWSILAREPYLCRSTDEWRHFQRHLDLVGGPQMDISDHDCSRETLLTLVAAGDGVTLLPESIAELGYSGVQFSPMADPRSRLEVCAVWRRETDNPALRRFMALTRDWLKKNRSPPPVPSSLA